MARRHRWGNVFRSRRLDRELEDELQHHLAETTDRLVAEGLPEREAFREARRRLGNYALQKERTREMNIAAWLDETRADVLYGVRQLRFNPGFAAVAILSLALGIGANSAIFQLVNAVRLKTLPVRNPHELVAVDFEKGSTRAGWWPTSTATMTYGIWEQIHTQQQAFTDVAAWSSTRFNLASGGEPRYAQGYYVSGEFFRTLGVSAAMGRTLSEQDNDGACNLAAVVSDAFWRRELGGDPNILGRAVSLEGRAFSVLGVTPPSFFGLVVGKQFDVALPLCAERVMSEGGRTRIAMTDAWWLAAIGRLKPGWTAQSAGTHLRTLSPGIMQATLPPGYTAALAKGFLENKLLARETGTGISDLRQEYERPLWILMAITALVLLIACANIANLLLARAAVREPEIAVRLAIGASRWRLVRQLLVESLLLALAGGALGAGIALALSRTLVSLISAPNNPIFIDLDLDWRALAFTLGLGVLTCLLFGLAPALRAAYLSPVSAMRSGGRSVTAGRERFSLRRGLIATQAALSLVLLFGALLFTRSFHKLLTVDAGFNPQGVLTAEINFSKAQIPKENRLLFYRELSDRLSSVSGVVSVSYTAIPPMSGGTWDNLIGPDREAAAASGKGSYFNEVGPGYFAAMGTRLIAGREFNERDTRVSPKVAIVNEEFAKRHFGGANPVGRTFHMAAQAGKPEPLFQVVGLTANAKYLELRENFQPVAFFPIEQSASPDATPRFMLRFVGPSGPLINKARAAVASLNPSIGIELRSFSTQLEQSLLREKLMATMSAGFGVLAALLATLGLYGVISYMAARRRHEFGVRIALGADRKHVIFLVLRETSLLLGIGLVAGLALSLWAGKAASTLLFGLQSSDLISLVGAGALLTTIGAIASYLPARRAAALNPIETLRNE